MGESDFKMTYDGCNLSDDASTIEKEEITAGEKITLVVKDRSNIYVDVPFFKIREVK